MKKNMEFLARKFLFVLMFLVMLFETFVPTLVLAVTYEDGNAIVIGGSPTIDGSNFEYEHGSVTITKNGDNVTTTSFNVKENDTIVITLTADDGYNYNLHNDVQNYNVQLTNNIYSFTIGRETNASLSFTPLFVSNRPEAAQEPQGSQEPQEPQEPVAEAIKYDFTINGETFTNVASGAQVIVSNNFNMNSLSQFYITKIAIEGGRTYTYSPNEYSYDMLDNQNKKIFEAHFGKISENFVNLRIESHVNDILDEDIANGKTREDYFGFYIMGIKFVKAGFKGVQISTNIKPDNYDFTTWNGADLSATTQTNPGLVTAYYGENTINLASSTSIEIAEIKLTENSGIPSSAISFNNETNEIVILSNYYNEIPLQVKLDDGTIGYIKINRIGIFIDIINSGVNTFYHGAASIISGNLNVETDKNRIVAVFYHEDTTTYEDYDLIANLTYADGKTETVISQGVGDVHNSTGNIIGSDYILWKGNSIENAPKKVSVTAVRKDAINDETIFGGVTFGSGAGVVWNRK